MPSRAFTEHQAGLHFDAGCVRHPTRGAPLHAPPRGGWRSSSSRRRWRRLPFPRASLRTSSAEQDGLDDAGLDIDSHKEGSRKRPRRARLEDPLVPRKPHLQPLQQPADHVVLRCGTGSSGRYIKGIDQLLQNGDRTLDISRTSAGRDRGMAEAGRRVTSKRVTSRHGLDACACT